jgi:hypothetical protein
LEIEVDPYACLGFSIFLVQLFRFPQFQRSTGSFRSSEKHTEPFKYLHLDLLGIGCVFQLRGLIFTGILLLDLTAKFFRDWFICFRIDKIHKQVVKFSKINPKALDELARWQPKNSPSNGERTTTQQSCSSLFLRLCSRFRRRQLRRYHLSRRGPPR